METLAVILIIVLCLVEAYCGVCFYYWCKWKSAQRTEARRAATRDRIYNEVRQSWAIERNRKDLWSSIEK